MPSAPTSFELHVYEDLLAGVCRLNREIHRIRLLCRQHAAEPTAGQVLEWIDDPHDGLQAAVDGLRNTVWCGERNVMRKGERHGPI